MATRRGADAERPDLAALAHALAALSDEERGAVLAKANEVSKVPCATVSWESFRAACGVVNLGGHAVEDTERLYDG